MYNFIQYKYLIEDYKQLLKDCSIQECHNMKLYCSNDIKKLYIVKKNNLIVYNNKVNQTTKDVYDVFKEVAK